MQKLKSQKGTATDLMSKEDLLKKKEKSPTVVIHVNERGSVDEEHEPGLQKIG